MLRKKYFFPITYLSSKTLKYFNIRNLILAVLLSRKKPYTGKPDPNPEVFIAHPGKFLTFKKR